MIFRGDLISRIRVEMKIFEKDRNLEIKFFQENEQNFKSNNERHLIWNRVREICITISKNEFQLRWCGTKFLQPKIVNFVDYKKKMQMFVEILFSNPRWDLISQMTSKSRNPRRFITLK